MDLGLFGSAVNVGGRAYTVRPPDVRTAIAALSAMAVGDYGLVREAVTGWLPVSLVSVLFSRAVDPGECARAIQECMMAGCPEATEKRQDEAEARAAMEGWPVILAEYRYAYKADPLCESWPYFLHQLAALPGAHARDMLRIVRAEMAARPDKETLRKLHAEAYPDRPGPEAPEHLRGQKGREYAMRKVAEFQAKMRRGKPVAEA